MVVVDAADLAAAQLGQEDGGVDDAGVRGDDIADVAAEGAVRRAVRAVDPGDRPPPPRPRRRHDAVEDRDRGRDADAGGDEDDGTRGGVGVVQEELARRVRQLDDVALPVGGVQPVGDEARGPAVAPRVPPDADAVVVGARRLAERVLAGLEAAELRDEDAQADVLAGAEARQRQRPAGAVLGREVEAGDLGRLGRAAQDPEAAPPRPAPRAHACARVPGRRRGGGERRVELRLALDEDVGERLVGGGPGGGDLGGDDGVAEDGGDGGEQVRADDGVLVGGDAEAGVPVGDALDGGRQPAEVVDVGGVGEHGGGESARLPPRRLARRVEDLVQLRVRRQHVPVEERRDLHAALLERRRRRLDDRDLRRREGGCCHGLDGPDGRRGGGRWLLSSVWKRKCIVSQELLFSRLLNIFDFFRSVSGQKLIEW